MFGKRLRAARIERKMTQLAVADTVNVALRTYQSYEQGVREPSMDILVHLADVLDVSVDYLLGRDEFLAQNKE